MKCKMVLAICVAFAMSGCQKSDEASLSNDVSPKQAKAVLVSQGKWITADTSNVMRDPQTSGLIAVNGELITIADGSAAIEQQRKLHFIDKDSAKLVSSSNTFIMSNSVRRSCFRDYLSNAPDLEALANDPHNPNVIYTVTEDATRTGTLSARCEQKYEATGSTDYPTLLVRLERDAKGDVTMTHVRPLQFPSEFNVGNFPNDGIEGMAMSNTRTLFLGLEKDKAGQPRIFSVQLTDDFWKSSDFAAVEDPGLSLPSFDSGSHPINGLALYSPNNSDHDYLLSAARNDNELWITNLDGQSKTKRIPLQFNVVPNNGCGEYVMDNASIEGLVVSEETLWLINDPWKQNYLKNIKCDLEAPRYEAMAPLLFSLPLSPEWFMQ